MGITVNTVYILGFLNVKKSPKDPPSTRSIALESSYRIYYHVSINFEIKFENLCSSLNFIINLYLRGDSPPSYPSVSFGDKLFVAV